MFEQIFTLGDVPKVFLLAFLELALSADNAVVLALIVHRLPEEQRKKALLIGIASAFLLRAGALLGASLFFQSHWLQVLGGIYLVYLAVRHLWSNTPPKATPQARSFWGIVALIELFDLVFAFDSILAGVAFIDNNPSKLWIVYLGGMIGLVGIRFAATLFARLLKTLPQLELIAYAFIYLVGLKLAAHALNLPLFPTVAILAVPLFWLIWRKKPWKT